MDNNLNVNISSERWKLGTSSLYESSSRIERSKSNLHCSGQKDKANAMPCAGGFLQTRASFPGFKSGGETLYRIEF